MLIVISKPPGRALPPRPRGSPPARFLRRPAPISIRCWEAMWWVYVLECRGGRLYTGATSNLRRRLDAHREGRGGRFTRAFPPVRLRATRGCPSRSAALSLEARIKRQPRSLKIATLTSGRPAPAERDAGPTPARARASRRPGRGPGDRG